MDDDRRHFDERALEIAAFRHRVIAEALEAGEGEVAEAVRTAASLEYATPGGGRCRPDARTVWRWLAAYRRGGLFALCPKRRTDRGSLRAFPRAVLERAVALRREGTEEQRATATIIDILRRERDPAAEAEPLAIARSTLDRHFGRLGVSRRQLRSLGRRPFTRIETSAPLELVVVDFHHGPFVRVGPHGEVRRALLCAFIDHFSRYVPEARYYLHEDFAALRFGFRRLLAAFGLPVRMYADNGASFQSHRFHGACHHLGITLVHSRPYVAESRGVIERFNGTLKGQLESEVKERDELLALDDLNATSRRGFPSATTVTSTPRSASRPSSASATPRWSDPHRTRPASTSCCVCASAARSTASGARSRSEASATPSTPHSAGAGSSSSTTRSPWSTS